MPAGTLEALSEAEEAAVRAYLDEPTDVEPIHGLSDYGIAARLLATLDAARSEVPGLLDVERLARAICTAIDGPDTPVRNVDIEEARDIAREYAALSPGTPETGEPR